MPATERLLSLQEFNRLKFERILPIYELGISRQQIAYWRREGLLLFIEKGRWGKVSCVDAIWLMLLDSVRGLGLGIGTMKTLTEYFLKRGHDDDVARQNLLHNKVVLEKRKTTLGGTLDGEDKRVLDDINDTLQNHILLYALRWDVNYFSNLITHSLLSRSEVAILIFADGQIVEQGFSGHRTFPEKKVDLTAPHIKLSLNYYLKEFVSKKELSQFLLLTHLFSKEEQAVLEEIKNKNVSEIVITLSGGEIKRIDSTQQGSVTDEQAKEIRRVLGLKNYERIVVDTRDATTLSVRRTKKIKKK